MAPSHPLSILTIEETNIAREIVLAHYDKEVIDFREIFLQEPPKAELTKYLDLEHSGRLSPTSPCPARLAKCQYDVIGTDRIPAYHESVVNINTGKRIKHEIIGKEHQAALTL